MTQNNDMSNEQRIIRKTLRFFYWLVTSAVFISGCAQIDSENIADESFEDDPIARYAHLEYSDETGEEDIGMALVKQKLYQQFAEWQGTPYQEAGASKSGTDCSGYVFQTFKTQFDIVLPRSSDEQAHIGEDVDSDNLQVGDLVFFKTGFSLRHVGIFLEDGTFMHASSTNGVMISGLDETYWKEAYWKAKRIPLIE